MKIKWSIPALIFFIVLIILGRALHLSPSLIPSPLVNKKAPSFNMPDLFTHKTLTEKDFIHQVTLLNVWASWCVACAEEHAFLLQLSHTKIKIIGLDYKDNKADALRCLRTSGNPYTYVGFDEAGDVAIDWGVYGTPESFLIDKSGIIRLKYVGPLSAEVWEKNIAPLVAELQAQP
jgi:cytochrome c biogenesis protein CcmG/thiol:disulfide interchange protein DsbE